MLLTAVSVVSVDVTDSSIYWQYELLVIDVSIGNVNVTDSYIYWQCKRYW